MQLRNQRGNIISCQTDIIKLNVDSPDTMMFSCRRGTKVESFKEYPKKTMTIIIDKTKMISKRTLERCRLRYSAKKNDSFEPDSNQRPKDVNNASTVLRSTS